MPSPLTAHLDILWQTPITAEPPSPGRPRGISDGLVLGQGALKPDGQAIFLGRAFASHDARSVLLLNAQKTGPAAAVPVPLPMPDTPGPQWTGTWFKRQRPNRNPEVWTLAVDGGGNTWLGGSSNSYMGIASDSHSDAYLAKLDGTGRLAWQQSYERKVELRIESIAPSPTGGAAVAGSARGWSWLARIGSDGKLEAEHRFGAGKGAAVVASRDGRFLVAGFAGHGEKAAYREDIAVWSLDGAGQLHSPIPIREAINRNGSAYFGNLVASPTADGGAYVASRWSDQFAPRAVEIAHVDENGSLLWRRELPETISGEAKPSTFVGCDPALESLPNGDALVACAMNGEIQLYRLDRRTGEAIEARMPLPDAEFSRTASLFLLVRPDGTILMAGTRSRTSFGSGSSWMGRLVLHDG